MKRMRYSYSTQYSYKIDQNVTTTKLMSFASILLATIDQNTFQKIVRKWKWKKIPETHATKVNQNRRKNNYVRRALRTLCISWDNISFNIFDFFVVKVLRILCTKSIISQRLKIGENRNLFLIRFRTLCKFLEQKPTASFCMPLIGTGPPIQHYNSWRWGA